MANKYRIVALDNDDSRVAAAKAAEQLLYNRYHISAKMHYIRIPDIGIYVRVCEIGEGVPLLIVPGNTGDSFPFVPLMAELQGKRIITLNRPGGGLSEGFDHHMVDFRRLANITLRHVMDYFEIEHIPVAAHSMGGHWSLWFAADQPERVERLVLLGSPGNVLSCSPPLPLRLSAVPGINRLLFPAIVSRAPEKALKGLAFMGHQKEALSRLPAEMGDCYHAFQHLPNYMASSLSLMETTNTLFHSSQNVHIGSDVLHSIEQPVLLVWGQNDPFGNEGKAREIAHALPDARLIVVGNGGHLPWLDEPEKCGEWVSGFLGEKRET